MTSEDLPSWCSDEEYQKVVNTTNWVILAITIMLALLQFRLSYLYFKRSKNLSEAGKMPKYMVWLATFQGPITIGFSAFTWERPYNLPWYMTLGAQFFWFLIFLSKFFNYFHWLRFRKIQLQLRHETEKNADIVKSLTRLHYIELFFRF